MNSLLRRSQGDWPFRAGRSPFYYGWVIAAVSTLGFIMSIPGQTMGMAVFADAFMDGVSFEQYTMLVSCTCPHRAHWHQSPCYPRYHARIVQQPPNTG